VKPGTIVAVVLAVVLAGSCIACAIGGALYGNTVGSSTPTPDEPTTDVAQASTSPAATASPRDKVSAKPKAAKGFGNGEWLVGVDIAPGRYQSDGPEDGYLCYWQLTTVPGATPGEPGFVTNDVPDGHVYVSLKKGQYFQSRRCAPWTAA
jgi:hypothetical protein